MRCLALVATLALAGCDIGPTVGQQEPVNCTCQCNAPGLTDTGVALGDMLARSRCRGWMYDARAYREAMTIDEDRLEGCARQVCDLLGWPGNFPPWVDAWDDCVSSYFR
jgi:hypothetical protein